VPDKPTPACTNCLPLMSDIGFFTALASGWSFNGPPIPPRQVLLDPNALSCQPGTCQSLTLACWKQVQGGAGDSGRRALAAS